MTIHIQTFEFDIKFWIFIPVYNFAKYLNKCFESLLTQTCHMYSIVVINDGSTDDSNAIINKWKGIFEENGNELTIINIHTNKGPGFTKWRAIEYIRQVAENKNDIFTILDGDDYYATNSALEIIFLKYLETKCWFTYGSAEGEYTNQVAPISNDIVFRLREKRPTFQFVHPRSCLIFLLDYIDPSDFQDCNGGWLLRSTEKQFVYKCIEMAGYKRVYNIQHKLYIYRAHPDNVRHKISNDYKLAIDDSINNRKPATSIVEKIHLIMCCYKRHHNLEAIIKSIENQSIADRIVLHIINTNPEKWDETINVKKKLLPFLKNITLKFCNTQRNLYGYARFLYTKQLIKTENVPYVIFFDDDQILQPMWVENIYNQAEPMTYVCWFGRIFNKSAPCERISYWNDMIDSGHRKIALYPADINTFDYGATCGCLIDTNVFRLKLLFRCPTRYRNVEDLWLSFIVLQVLGKKIKLFRMPIRHDLFDDTEETALYLTIIDEKEAFLKMLIDAGFLKSTHINIDALEKILDVDDSEMLISHFTYQ